MLQIKTSLFSVIMTFLMELIAKNQTHPERAVKTWKIYVEHFAAA